MKSTVAFFADWANGIFAVALASVVTGTDVVWWHFLIGILVSHLPDIDALPELLQRGKVSASSEHVRDHRTFLHFPAITVPFMFLLVLFGGYWGVVVAISLTLHLINDLYGTGWGLKLLWPLSHTHYKILGRRANQLLSVLEEDGKWFQLSESERKLRVVVSWQAAELPAYITRYGVDDWIERWYFKLNWISFIEYTLFISALLVAALMLL